MTRDRDSSHQILNRIADALGTDVAAFSDADGRDHAVQEAVELLTAFERIADGNDRRACVAFVRAAAARQDAS